MKYPTVALIAIIAACIVMFGYLMVYVPYECSNLSVTSGGNATCGLESGAYVIAVISAIVAIAAFAMLIRNRAKA